MNTFYSVRTLGKWSDADTKALRAKVKKAVGAIDRVGNYAEARKIAEKCERSLDNLHRNTTIPDWLYRQQLDRIDNALFRAER